jgi:uncharacterized protein DUF6895
MPYVLIAFAAILAGASPKPEDRKLYQEEIAKARSWLDALEIDPIELRAHGIKGKKKLVELFDAYAYLLKVASPKDKKAILARVRQAAAPTYQDRYHDMATIPDEEFKQDATSYLRAALLLERFGLDTKRYRAEIKKVEPRLSEHLKVRGPNQRRIFHTYYQHFGLKEPFPLEKALAEGIIAHRKDPAQMSLPDAYDFTHEIYGVYDFGEKLNVDPWSAEDKKYIASTLERLTSRSVEQRGIDITAELVTCGVYLGLRDSKAYRGGVELLLHTQNPDGSWGSYENQKKRLGEWAKPALYLHTTLVVVGALTTAFRS